MTIPRPTPSLKLRHALFVLAYFVTLAAGLAMGYAIGHHAGEHKAWGEIHVLQKKVERFENPAVFHHAEYVAKLTHTSLYQVLTGKK